MKKIIIAALLLASTITVAFADNTGKSYVAADLGRGKFTRPSTYDSDTFGMMRIAGGYYFNQQFAMEAAYVKLADQVYTGTSGTATFTTSMYQVAGVMSIPLNSAWDLIAKLGVAHRSTKGSTTGTGITISGSNPFTHNSLTYAVGAQYHLSQSVTLRGQYENFGEYASGSDVNITAFSAGVVYMF